MTLSELVHQRVMTPPGAALVAANENAPQVVSSVAALTLDLVRQLRAVGINLNQIARHANATGILAHDRLGPEFAELSNLLKLIDRQLDRLL